MKRKNKIKSTVNDLDSWVNWVFSTFSEFLVLLHIILFIESIFPKGACIQIHLVVSFAVQAFEWIRARFTLLGFQSWRVCLEVYLATSGEVTVVFNFMESITFDVFWPLNFTHESCMPLLPIVLALEYAWVHVCSTYHCNIASHIKGPVNRHFSWRTALHILNVYPDDSHIRFRKNFSNP